MTLSELGRILAMLAEVYRREDVTQQTAKAWHVMLDADNIDAEAFARAAADHARTEKFFPAPSQLLDRCRPKLPSPAEAWLEVRTAIRREGYMGKFKSDNPAAVKAVEAITWDTLCAMTSDQVPALQAQFRTMYEQFAKREEAVALGAPQGLGQITSKESEA